MPPLGAQSFARVDAAYDPSVAGFDATRRAAAVGAAVGEAKAKGVLSAGFLEASAAEWVLANSHGFFGSHQETRVEMTMTARRVGSPKPIPWRSGPLGSPGPRTCHEPFGT